MHTQDEIIQEFLVESRDNIDLLDRELVALEEDPRSQARLASVFRTIHTIKGTAGFLAFKKLELIAHAGESLLSRLRDGTIALNVTRASGLLVMVDAIRKLLSQIEASGREGPEHYGALVETLSLLCDDASVHRAELLLQEIAVASSAVQPESSVSPPVRTGESPSHSPRARSAPPASKTGEADPSKSGGATADKSAAARVPPEEPKTQLDSRLRVDVGLLDRLMTLVGELVLARNQLLQHSASSGDTSLVNTCQRVNFITTELQEGVMKTRMQPIDNVWNRFPRIVRDLAHSCGKQVTLEMDGRSTELDKTIIEAIADPLTHLVRNAIDHGIERPELRVAAGKPIMGTLRLRAFHEGGRVNIEIADDGGGIDVDRVRRKAIERGLLTPERARAASQHELVQLIFTPGFSTADQVTSISGRGVGMDVVYNNIERIGGSVEVESRKGLGTSIRIKIPLTLAIIPALLVGANGERFAIPQVNLVELVRFDAEQARTSVERIHGVPVFRLRGNLVALVELSQVLGLPAGNRDEYNIVVLQADDRQFGLIVDSIYDTEEIVVKPLSRDLKGLNVYAGATIMGDGRVALILDGVGLANQAELGSTRNGLRGRSADKQTGSQPADPQRLVLFRNAGGGRMALPLESVARLEEFPESAVEFVGNDQVVQYRGEILPLVHLSDVFGSTRSSQPLLQVVVHSSEAGSVGFVVDAIEDIVEAERPARLNGGRAGTIGSMVIQGRVTELLDADALRAHALGSQ